MSSFDVVHYRTLEQESSGFLSYLLAVGSFTNDWTTRIFLLHDNGGADCRVLVCEPHRDLVIVNPYLADEYTIFAEQLPYAALVLLLVGFERQFIGLVGVRAGRFFGFVTIRSAMSIVPVLLFLAATPFLLSKEVIKARVLPFWLTIINLKSTPLVSPPLS